MGPRGTWVKPGLMHVMGWAYGHDVHQQRCQSNRFKASCPRRGNVLVAASLCNSRYNCLGGVDGDCSSHGRGGQQSGSTQ